jgi:2-dehydropantoate 2-reductase
LAIVDEGSCDMSKDTTTVAVLGPGAVGGMFAVALARAGVRVVCVGDAEAAAAIRRDGLTLVRRGNELRAQPEAAEELQEPVDFLLVTVKAPALEDALVRVGSDADVVVPLLNGLEHVDRIRALLGGRVVAASLGRLEAYREGRTTIVQTTATPVVTLAGNGATAGLFRRAGADVRDGGSERLVLWEKVARLAPLVAATALTQRPVGDLRADPEWRRRLEHAIAEACAVATAEGVDLDPAAQWAIIDAMPPDLTTSAARDVAARRPSELGAITGAVVRAARRLAVPCPTLEGLFAEADARCRPRSR